ncbi:MAG: hypothetical protein OXH99_22395 [Bryobacterales bacterium]|nr:hypothetical protein [Bryobacterales bacterium]
MGEAPLTFSSPNAPTPRDLPGTLVLSKVAGGQVTSRQEEGLTLAQLYRERGGVT